MASKDRSTILQKLHAATGDRDREANELAKQVTENSSPSAGDDAAGANVPDADAPDALDEVAKAARKAVADAHGDSGVSEATPETPDVARPSDVDRKLKESPGGIHPKPA